MRTLIDIINAAKAGEKATIDELRYALCALESLSTFDGTSLRRLATCRADAMTQYEESFNRWKRALAKSPKDWLGWENDPFNPEYVKRRNVALKLFDKVSDEKGQ